MLKDIGLRRVRPRVRDFKNLMSRGRLLPKIHALGLLRLVFRRGLVLAVLGVSGNGASADCLAKADRTMGGGEVSGVAQSEVVGHFASSKIDEASGLARTPDGRWAVINDSGDQGRVFLSRNDGSDVREVTLKIRPWDTEDLDIGECPRHIAEGETCMAVADIGDNRTRRVSAVIHFFRWKDIEAASQASAEKAPPAVTPLWSFYFKYANGPRNAEAFRILSDQEGIIVTKQQNKKKQLAEPAEVYRLRWRDQTAKLPKFDDSSRASKPLALKGPGWPTAQFMSLIDVPALIRDKGLAGLVTGMAISPDRSRVLLLTYGAVVETRWEAKAERMEFGESKVIRFSPLEQQEAIAYDERGRGFVITTEVVLSLFAQPFRKRQGAPIVAIRDPYCEDRLAPAKPTPP